MLHLGSIILDGTPRVIVAVRDDAPLDELAAVMAAGVELVELRIDQFQSRDPAYVVGQLERLAAYPRLGTIRCASEGGAWQGTEAEREALFRGILPHVEAIDVELSAKDMLPGLIEAAHADGKLVIGSYHDFQGTPIPKRLAGAANDGKLLGVDIVKVAVQCNSLEDVQVLAQFTGQHADKNLITIGMGAHGMLTRIFFPAIGSLMTYTFLGEPTAPGQLNCHDTLEYLKNFYPDFPGQEAESAAAEPLSKPELHEWPRPHPKQIREAH